LPSWDPGRDAFWRTLIADRTPESFPAPPHYVNFHRIFEESLSMDAPWPPRPEKLENYKKLVDPNYRPGSKSLGAAYPTLAALLAYSTQFVTACHGRSFSTMKSGRIGLVPPRSCVGDLVCIIPSLQTPFLLRRHPTEQGVYLLVGECYVHGMMNGEMITRACMPSRFTVA